MPKPVIVALGIGGWFPARDQAGNLSPWLSSWFSLEITREDFPWIFEKENPPTLVISTLEAFAMLVALKLRFSQDPEPDETRVLIVPSITDNRGNGAALNKLMSTRFPSSAVFYEGQADASRRGVGATGMRTFLQMVSQICLTRNAECQSVRSRWSGMYFLMHLWLGEKQNRHSSERRRLMAYRTGLRCRGRGK